MWRQGNIGAGIVDKHVTVKPIARGVLLSYKRTWLLPGRNCGIYHIPCKPLERGGCSLGCRFVLDRPLFECMVHLQKHIRCTFTHTVLGHRLPEIGFAYFNVFNFFANGLPDGSCGFIVTYRLRTGEVAPAWTLANPSIPS